MNGKRIFSYNQFTEAFLQLKIIGIAVLIISVIFTIIPNITRVMLIINNPSKVSDDVEMISYISTNYQYFLIFIIAAPIFTYLCWNFLNKRYACDFYHSIPYTRECFFISRVIAIVAWITIIISVTCISAVIIHIALQNYYLVEISSIITMFLAIWSASILTIAGTTLSCTITGTLFNNICGTVIILLLPRFLITVILKVIALIVPIAVSGNMAPLLDNKYNMVTGILFAGFSSDMDNINFIITSRAAFWYTILLAIIYIVAAGVAFARRKSEMAGKALLNRRIQFIIRMIIAFTISALGMIICMLQKWEGMQLLPRSVMIIIFILASVIITLLYELISSKNFSKLHECLSAVLVANMLSIILYFGMGVLIDNFINYLPESDNIDYVAVMDKDMINNKGDYFSHMQNITNITDDSIITMLCEAISENAKHIKIDEKFELYTESNNCKSYKVKFQSGRNTIYRYVYLTEANQAALIDNIKNDKEYCQLYTSLPQNAVVKVINNGDFTNVPSSVSDRVYTKLCEEIKEIEFEDWYNTVGLTSDFIGAIEMTASINYNDIWLTAKLPITNSTPETLELYCNLVNEYNRQKGLFKDMLNKKVEDNNYNYIITVRGMSEKTGKLDYKYYIPKDFLNKKNNIFDEICNEIINTDSYDYKYDFNIPIIRIVYNLLYNEGERKPEASNVVKDHISYYVQLKDYKYIEDFNKD